MAEKKLLTYEGLEEYNIKWHERLQAMAIDIDEIDNTIDDTLNLVWKFTINTEADQSGAKKTGIPFHLDYKDENIVLTVNWGDGNISTLTKNNYSEWGSVSHEWENNDFLDTEASIHTYENPGIYTIRVKSNDWNNTYILTDDVANYNSSNAESINLWWSTLIKLDTIYPAYKGVFDLETTSGYADDAFYVDGGNPIFYYSLLSKCHYLTSIPDKTIVTGETFYGDNLYECYSLKNFSLKFTSANLYYISDTQFFPNSPITGNEVRTIYVPSGSRTETTILGMSSKYNLTVIGE